MATYATRNMFRRKGRTILTIVVVMLAVLSFALIRTVLAMWNAGADEALHDRLATRHKASITMQLPRRYIDEVRAVPGIKSATWAVWFGAKDPKKRIPFFAGFAADQDSWFNVMDDMAIEPEVLARWKATKNGAVLGDVLAKTFKVKVGDKLIIASDIYEGDWEFEVVGLYKPMRRTVDRNTMVFRWDYLNDDPRAAFVKDQIGWVMSRTSDPGGSATVSRAIDKLFEARDDQTLTMSERAFQLSFLGGFSAILKAFDYGSFGILLIMMLILANTVAMGVRERTHEYGVLRAIGFRPSHILAFVLGEAALIALVGAIIGVLIVALLVNGVMGPWLEENMAQLFPYFRTPTSVMVTALIASAVIGAAAAAIPAYRASRLKVTDALRRID